MLAKFPFYKQLDAMDCGPSSLRMIAKHYGRSYTLQTLRDKCYITREGVSLMGISDAAESIGLHTMGVRINWETLTKEAPLPCIAHWKQNHFVVVYKIKKNKVFVADPAIGHIEYSQKEFLESWLSTRTEGENKGICLLVEPTPEFYKDKGETIDKSNTSFLFSYLRPHKKLLLQLFFGLIIGSLIQLIFPFLTQSVVDFGISNNNIGFVWLILIAQLTLYISRTSVEFIRSWILLHISARINISLISDFLVKLMKLPISFFDIKMIGDLLQRIGDHSRIQNFLTTSTLEFLFSFVNFLIFGAILAVYSIKIFAVFLIGTLLYILWIFIFLKRRRSLDYKRFAQLSENQSTLIQLITGMQEIKLNNCEKQKRWDWEKVQARLFKINIKSLSLAQYEQAGSLFLNELKNIFISFIAAKLVIEGQLTLGMMLAVQYIIGQLNAPVQQLIGFIHALQDAKISLERLGEIHKKEDEEQTEEGRMTVIPEESNLNINNVFFQYEGPHSEMVLHDINLVIPYNKTTAIVGGSGSGKTTLVKLLLGFYPPVKGEILVGGFRIDTISTRLWRQNCGTVMQDGFIFSDTIAKNIAVSDETIDKERLVLAARTANIHEFVMSLPLRFNTKIGADGHGLSQGQKQRILIARAVYKDPAFLFFDEATNALDANNEKIIMNNLDEFFKNRTAVVVAHRLSTVKNADQIVVLEKGRIVEKGTHAELIETKGAYYELVKNQLEIGS
ncbi:MAG: ABC transporter ATP-binding protein [Bacteroidetes bacterium RIFOXYA12_FULL_35_11]|nr:MAG: ABC transporter ATP-binding protein [Bacteroidetes bacterium GWF2_35_48]OFY83175.1 MAG: ABC transporter ATP-binding protein [Bacteroidetes bacterium RIFOXYA12_FULL_35_11]OFY93963.1 MAG: ABC transporter ATP-binding protein [Bacteroidetes bacterium RIFOXYB2_FULL_35_7]OFY97351.1 MAG: ABC transporter ATP-binding protein [Bacteroidetes bacterium RIFOXYC12_FULL_35_7]